MSQPAINEGAQALDIPTFPLTGRRLIEASAGTGKTFTLAALYVRLILGHGGEAAFVRPMMPPEILVVTFTEAATQELRDRIRARLMQARDVLLGIKMPDAVLEAVLGSIESEAASRGAARLDQAARLMDDAAIFTIHGFCQRMLKRHAFDSGSLFASTLVQDIAPLYQQVVDDYWRRRYYPLEGALQRLILERWSGPDALAAAVSPLLQGGRPAPLCWAGERVEAPASVAAALEPVIDAQTESLAQKRALRDMWVSGREAMTAEIEAAISEKRVNGRSFKQDDLEPKLSALADWLEDGTQMTPPRAIRDSKGHFWCGQARFDAAANKQKTPPRHAFFEGLDRYQETLSSITEPTPALLAHARDEISEALLFEKRRQAQWTFDDLLNELDNALSGPAGPRLAERIRTELPVALIDEFQDTDPTQYRIFSTIYPDPAAEDHALLLIGDPKQAIYGFRGADIATYLSARRSARTHHTLVRNFRSTHAMVDAVNQLFSMRAVPFSHEDIPFQPVSAKGLERTFVHRDQVAPALTFWWPSAVESIGTGEYQRQMATALTRDVQSLLAGGQAGTSGFDTASGERVPVRPADIAILVRTGLEAERVREALEAGGIKSVYLSQKRSVFESDTAFQLLQVLEAVASPRDDRRLKGALGTRLLSNGLGDVVALIDDELGWESMIERFDEYHRRWRREGVLPMLRAVMHEFEVGARLLAQPDGERRLTDFLHLGELAQKASQFLDGEQALLRWMHRGLSGRFDEGLDADALVQRLESDDALVRVITLHKSKGLQYPIVYLPFIGNYRDAATGNGPVPVLDAEGGKMLAWHLDEAQRCEAEQARLEEDVRLLYVGLTRAQFACRVGLAPVYKGRKARSLPSDATTLSNAAIGWLVAGDAECGQTGAEIKARLEALSINESIACTVPPEAVMSPPRFDRETHDWQGARIFDGAIDRRFFMTSYSGVMALAGSGQQPAAEIGEGLDTEVLKERTPTPPPPGRTLLAFERGPRAGTFLHHVLDRVDWARLGTPAHDDALGEWLDARLAQSGFETRWRVPLMTAVAVLGQRAFVPEGRLIDMHRWRTELEFWLSVPSVELAELDRIICALDPLPVRRPALGDRKLHGMLKGYIDLVAEFDGRYYIIDWKSNHLGEGVEDYDEASMARAIAHHRYDVQYWLYSLALHRLLRARLPNYDPERHFGGVRYVFLRALAFPEADGFWCRRPDPQALSRLDVLFNDEVSGDARTV
ncbi:exodeoxyribonuclease V subunit beta [Larsenimonas suaedae]|uniref:RecBCD enzyme subunit RecB n=1 Tax=Larsenimonas suaedae TaxID=1851019 RepID=A0ABU1GTA6_9GAMM|nr:exodeoxyribonuclease V subunit beta [Larsenimonas suaedae]MCM2971708.1 exodeoxyribonuclease V subunit beta [Larsenimonas suaedae]MDR5895260.1 exodeoxyribonuclease V subunit beta [Larsenimonas suaedae]